MLSQEGEEEDWGEEGEVGCGSEGGWVEVVAAVVQGEQEDGCDGGGDGDRPWGAVIEQGEGGAGEGDGGCDEGEMAEGEARGGVGGCVQAGWGAPMRR